MLRLKSSIIFFLTIIPWLLKAQVIYEYSDTSNFVFTYVPFERSINNKVLNQLALAHLKIPDKTSFNYKLRHRVSVSYRQSDSLYVLLDVKPLEISGDIHLRDFNLERLLIPSAYEVHIEINDPQSGIILNSSKTVIMDQGMTSVGTFPDSLWKDGTDIHVDIQGIRFTEKDYDKMVRELMSIRDYYASSLLADSLSKKIQNARRNSWSFKDVASTYIIGFKGISLIDAAMNAESDLVPGRDPMKIVPKIPLLKYNLQEYTEYITQNQKTLLIGNVYREFASAYIKSLKDASALSRSVDYYSSPFIYKLYSNSINSWQVNSLYRMFLDIIKSRGISHVNSSQLKHEVLKGFLKESNTLIKANRYVEAVDLLTGSVKIKNLPLYDPLSDDIENALGEARKGLVISYTEIMQKALDKNLLSLAEKYLVEVENYTTRFKMNNSENGPFKDIYIRMAESYIHLGANSISKKNYSDALNEFTKAVDLLNGYQSTLKMRAEDGLLMAVRSIYQGKIAKTETEIERGNYVEASVFLEDSRNFASRYPSFYPDKTYQYDLERKISYLLYKELINNTLSNKESSVSSGTIISLCEAVSLCRKYQFSDKAIIDTLTMGMGLRYLNDQFSKARLQFWAKKPDSALQTANEAYAMSARLDLNYLPSVREQYDKIVQLASETSCNEAKGEFNSLLNKTKTLFSENKISQAVSVANQAKELAFAKSSCGLTTAEVNKVLARFKQQIRWNELNTKASELLREKKYIEATSLIQQAESIYSYYRLDTNNLVNVGYFDLAIESDDVSLITFAVSHLVSQGKLDQAFLLLDKLRVKGIPERETQHLQEMLARNLSQRDFAETPDLNAKDMLEIYTKGYDWYGKFESVYRYYFVQQSKSPGNSSRLKK